jgi:hypothetical protein
MPPNTVKTPTNTHGQQKSYKGALYDARADPRRTAGYLGLNDTAALKELYKSATFKKIWEEHESERLLYNWKLNRISSVMEQIEKTRDQLRLGTANPDKQNWNCQKLFAHSVCRLLADQNNLPGNPQFGPLENENEIEAWNRAYTLLSNFKYMSGPSKKAWFEDTTSNQAAKRPPFMLAVSEDTAPVQTAYTPSYTFECTWMNKRAAEEALDQQLLAESIEAHTKIGDMRFPIIDPRIFDAAQVRDDVRREINCLRFNLNINQLFLCFNEVPNDPNTWMEFDSDGSWDTIQEKLRAAQTVGELDLYRFEVTTMTNPPNRDTWECDFPADLANRSVPTSTG